MYMYDVLVNCGDYSLFRSFSNPQDRNQFARFYSLFGYKVYTGKSVNIKFLR